VGAGAGKTIWPWSVLISKRLWKQWSITVGVKSECVSHWAEWEQHPGHHTWGNTALCSRKCLGSCHNPNKQGRHERQTCWASLCVSAWHCVGNTRDHLGMNEPSQNGFHSERSQRLGEYAGSRKEACWVPGAATVPTQMRTERTGERECAWRNWLGLGQGELRELPNPEPSSLELSYWGMGQAPHWRDRPLH
jgi:hypothetical protein